MFRSLFSSLLCYCVLFYCYGDIMILLWRSSLVLYGLLTHALKQFFHCYYCTTMPITAFTLCLHVLSWMQVLRSSHYTSFWLQVGIMISFMVIKFSWIQSFKILLSPSKVGMCSRRFRFGPDSLSWAVLLMLFFVKKTWNQTVQILLSCSPCLNRIFGVLDI